jgi:hypothetical protein
MPDPEYSVYYSSELLTHMQQALIYASDLEPSEDKQRLMKAFTEAGNALIAHKVANGEILEDIEDDQI